MPKEVPANPLAIELSVTHKRLWWQTGRTDEQPERWEVSADIWGVEDADEEERHVGDISLALADLSMRRDINDAAILGDWIIDFIAELVADPALGELHPDLESRFSPGPPHLVVIRHIEISEPWRGVGLGKVLTASVLRTFARYARLAACYPDPAKLSGGPVGEKLEHLGFHRWRDAYVVDLRAPSLEEASTEVIGRWWTEG